PAGAGRDAGTSDGILADHRRSAVSPGRTVCARRHRWFAGGYAPWLTRLSTLCGRRMRRPAAVDSDEGGRGMPRPYKRQGAGMADAALLEVSDIETCYGLSQVLFGLSLVIVPGEVVTLMGRNGMGKTTTVRSLMGLTPAMAGSIRFAGEEIRALPAYRIAKLGIGLVPEGRQVFPNLTARENLVATASNRRRASPAWTLARVCELFPRLAERLTNMGSQLSGGEQQMLAIGRALMTNPRLLVLDAATQGP